MAAWPGSSALPQNLEYQGYTETAPDNVLRTKMGVGPDKLRRRETAAIRPFSGSMVLTTTQVHQLEIFYITTLSYGVIAFNWTRPSTTVIASIRFVEPPKYSALADELWRAKMSFEELP